MNNSSMYIPSSINNTARNKYSDADSNFSGLPPRTNSVMKPPKYLNQRDQSPEVGPFFGQARDSLGSHLQPKSSISQADYDKGGFSDNKSASYNDVESYVNMV
jgi:hypothetical protein